jgi:hypothetical protein
VLVVQLARSATLWESDHLRETLTQIANFGANRILAKLQEDVFRRREKLRQ